jgi:hypothetical protein
MFDKTRADILKLLEGLTPEQVYVMPAGFRNNLLWNLGHVLVIQQTLFYEQSGLPLRIPPHYLEMFRKGTHPGQWTMSVNPDEVKAWLKETSRMLRIDMASGIFKSFAPYQTSWGCRLANLPDILAFTAWHESLHFGIMSAMRKLV